LVSFFVITEIKNSIQGKSRVKVTTERTPNCSAVITVEVDDDQVQRALRSAAARLSKIRPIPGFRPGKAPYERVERVIGKEVLLDEAIDTLAQQLYPQVLTDEKIDVYDAGKLDVVQREPLILKFTVPTRPVVTLGDYRAIHMHPQPVHVSEDEVSQVIERFRLEQATMAPVTRPVQLGDLATLNVSGGVEGFTQINQEGLEVRIEKEKAVFPWLEQLVGANIGETRTITYTYPADDADSELAGKVATYTVVVTDLKEPQLPNLDDEFAQSISSFETFDLLKERVRASLLAEKQAEEDNRFADQVIDAVVDQAQIAYPESMLDDEVESEVARAKGLARRLGLTWNKYLQLAGKTESAYREEVKPRAERRLKRLLTLLQLVEAENIQVTDKEVDVEIDLRAMSAARQGGNPNQVRRELSTPDSRRDIEFSLKLHKAIDFLVASAKGEPTSGKILTPEMLRQEELARRQAEAQATPTAPTGLITDPSQVNSQNLPSQLGKIILPGQESQ
jgi:trigger factor